MEKNSRIKLLLVLAGIFLWLFFIGQINGVSALHGDITLIDEGQYAAWIFHMLSHKVIYKDIYVQYSPLQVFPPYLLIKFFGQTLFFVRLWNTTIATFLGIIVAVLFGRYLKINPRIQILTLLFLVLIPGVNIRYWIAILCFIVAASVKKKRSFKHSLFLGILISISLLQSVEVGAFLLLLIGLYFLPDFFQKKRRSIALGIIFGTLMPLGVFATWAYSQGWLMSYLSSSYDFTISASGVNLPNGQGLPNIFLGQHSPYSGLLFLKFLFSQQMLFYLSLLLVVLFISIVIIRFLLKIANERDTIMLLTLSFTCMMYATIIGRSGHYFILVPFVLMGASYFISLGLRNAQAKNFTTKTFMTFIVFLFIGYGIRHIVIFRFSDFFKSDTYNRMVESVSGVSPVAISRNQAADIAVLRNFINNNTQKSDMIYVFNNEPALYFLLRRENPTQYDLPMIAIQKSQRQNIILSLKKSSPKIIIEDKTAWAIDGVSDRSRMPEVYSFILANYPVTKRISHFIFYSKKEL